LSAGADKEPGAGSFSNDLMSLDYPIGIFLDGNNSLLYVADQDNHRIQKWRKSATLGVIITGDPYGISDGTTTKLSYPL